MASFLMIETEIVCDTEESEEMEQTFFLPDGQTAHEHLSAEDAGLFQTGENSAEEKSFLFDAEALTAAHAFHDQNICIPYLSNGSRIAESGLDSVRVLLRGYTASAANLLPQLAEDSSSDDVISFCQRF